MRDFDYLEPATVAEASQLLADFGDDARAFAGGTALLLAMRQRMLVPTHLISLAGIDRLRGITVDEAGWLKIGAMTRHAEIATSPLVNQRLPMLARMAGELANPQIRNQGTLGGNLCYGDPSTDPPTCLIALGAEVVIGGIEGERRLPVEEFLVDYFVTALEPGELVVEVLIPPRPEGEVGCHRRHRRTAAEHRPLVNFAFTATVDGQLCRDVRIVIGACVPVAGRVARAEALLASAPVDLALIDAVATAVSEDIDALADARCDPDYRREIARLITRRTLASALGLAKGETE